MKVPIPGVDSAATFEAYARTYFADEWGVELAARPVPVGGGVSKQFDLVSEDGQVVGDAKWYRSLAVPAAKWSTISEYVWLLQRVEAERLFLVFGNDIDVVDRYLHRFKPLVAPVEFYFLDGTGHRRL